jgi:hypothetical protein
MPVPDVGANQAAVRRDNGRPRDVMHECGPICVGSAIVLFSVAQARLARTSSVTQNILCDARMSAVT